MAGRQESKFCHAFRVKGMIYSLSPVSQSTLVNRWHLRVHKSSVDSALPLCKLHCPVTEQEQKDVKLGYMCL